MRGLRRDPLQPVSGGAPLRDVQALPGLDTPPRWVFRGAAGRRACAAEPAGEAAEAAAIAAALAAGLGLPPALCRLLVARGHTDAAGAREYMKPRMEGLHDPAQLAGLDAALERLARAIRGGERILVHGDYDVDGICAATLFTRVLRSLGADVEPFVPHRMTDGYDLGHAGVRRAAEIGAGVILTGDCGIVAFDAVTQAAAAGIDVIITDHHTPGERLPPAAAVINPNRRDCTYPDRGLAGAGVAFKVCEALIAALGGDRDALLWHLDLVALATIADLAPLRGENRLLAHFGLRVLRQTRSTGLRALITHAGLDTAHGITAGHVSHTLAPRINAVGRMGAASRGLRLLLTDDAAEADALAAEMEAENRTRQAVDRQILDDALSALLASFDPARDYGIVLSAPDWHPGVIGIVASRIVERMHRPVVLIAEDHGTGRGRGSGRSIPAFHLYEGIHACAGLLERYGGHRQAAGLDVRLDRIAEFRDAFNAHARSVLSEADLVPELGVDLEIGLDEATPDLHRLLRHCGPFGLGNPQPVFVARRVAIAGTPRFVGSGQHAKLVLAQGDARLPAIGFRMADRLRALDLGRTPLDVAFQLHEETWNGRTQLQARLVDLRPAP
jgi:single-stranded-DNA-specific exonuclease